MLGLPEIFWIVLVLVLLFGVKKLPDLARAAGESIKEFKKATKEAMEEPLEVEEPRRMADSETVPERQTEPTNTSV